MPRKYALGIDLGGTNLRVALVSEEGEIIRKIKRPSSDIMASVEASVREALRDDVAGIGLGVAGLTDRKTNRVHVSPNLREIEGIDIVRELQTRFNLPVFMENDANAAALGEKIGGAGRSFDHFVMLTLGTGIGGGIIYKGKLLEVAAEIGHMSINSEGEKCPCGNTGCLENYASARAMTAKAVSMLEKGGDSLLKDCCKGSIYKVTPEDIYNAALEGDTLSREILRDAGKYLGIGLANLINIMSPEAIILTGGLLGAWNIYVQEAIKEASRRALRDLFSSVRIIPSSLGDNAGVVGAACLVFMSLGDAPPA
ncbi:MAG: ROK family protein [Nitrospiraceae bacterium]|nr:ROK family protein [Nitrospiraceae bacterium]